MMHHRIRLIAVSVIIIIIIDGLLNRKVTIVLNATQNIGDIEHGDLLYNLRAARMWIVKRCTLQ